MDEAIKKPNSTSPWLRVKTWAIKPLRRADPGKQPRFCVGTREAALQENTCLEIDELAHELSPVLTDLSPGSWTKVVPDCQSPADACRNKASS